jgi:hypothetical protein
MQLTDSKRRVVLGVLLCATLAATVWVNQRADAVPQVVVMEQVERPAVPARTSTALSDDHALPELQLETLQQRKELEETDEEVEIDTDLFAAKSWYVPPPPPEMQKPLPPPAPVAPSLPFTYMGSMEDGGHLVVYLAKGERAYSVGVGDTIEETYRVESMDGGQIVFTYLPMSIKQTLKIGS